MYNDDKKTFSFTMVIGRKLAMIEESIHKTDLSFILTVIDENDIIGKGFCFPEEKLY